MICKFVFIGLLATASLAAGLPTKTAQREEALTATKGERQLASPIEYQRRQQAQLFDQQRELSKTRLDEEPKRAELSKTTEQRREEQAPLKEPAEQRREETTQIREEPELHQQRAEEIPLTQQKEELPLAPTKSQNFYEAKTQIREEAPAKEEKLAVKTTEQVKLVEQPKFELPKLEQQKLEDYKLSKEQQRQEGLQRDISKDYEQQRETHYEQQQFGQQVELSKEYEQQRFEEQPAPLVQQQQEFDEQRAVGIKGEAPIPEKEPYAFDYSVEGSSRRESGDTKGVVRGQYTLSGADGSRRIVDYIADHNGFRAAVQTNEFGTESRGAANVDLQSSQPAAEDISLRLEGKTREFFNPPAAVKGQAPQPIEQLPAKPENWQVKGQTPIVEQLPAREQNWGTKSQPQLVEKLPTKTENANWSAKGQTQLVERPVKEVSRLEELPAAPAASKGEQLKVTEPERADVVKSAELRKPKSIEFYSSGRVSATAHRQVVHPQPIVSLRQHHHHRQVQPVAPVRHYATRPHHTHVPLAPARGVYREAPIAYQHQPVIAPAARVVPHIHEQSLRSHSQPRLAPYSILSEEDAPIGFEASSS